MPLSLALFYPTARDIAAYGKKPVQGFVKTTSLMDRPIGRVCGRVEHAVEGERSNVTRIAVGITSSKQGSVREAEVADLLLSEGAANAFHIVDDVGRANETEAISSVNRQASLGEALSLVGEEWSITAGYTFNRNEGQDIHLLGVLFTVDFNGSFPSAKNGMKKLY